MKTITRKEHMLLDRFCKEHCTVKLGWNFEKRSYCRSKTMCTGCQEAMPNENLVVCKAKCQAVCEHKKPHVPKGWCNEHVGRCNRNVYDGTICVPYEEKAEKKTTVWKNDMLSQLRHVSATPFVLRSMEESIQHLQQVVALAADEIERLQEENKKLKKGL